MTATPNDQPRVPDEVEREFADNLRAAAYIFQTTKNGRFQGSILACAAVARFIKRRGGPAEYAAPFMQIAEAFKDLERGGRPRLFSKKTVPDKEKERSPERTRSRHARSSDEAWRREKRCCGKNRPACQ
jgi:hypothetical protein